MTVGVQPPTGDCPKCGMDEAFQHVNPVYVAAESGAYESGRDWFYPEHLDWPCRQCGYREETPCLDAK